MASRKAFAAVGIHGHVECIFIVDGLMLNTLKLAFTS